MRSLGIAGLASAALIAAQAGPPRYRAAELACVGFAEEVISEIRTEAGGRSREERTGRFGLLIVRAAAGDRGLELSAWYDTLALFRETPEGKSTPDTEGLLGGRWRGTLAPAGVYVGSATPFIPDDIAEVADLHGALDDFFPKLPDRPIPSWWRWRDSTGEAPDTTADSLRVPVTRYTVEEGALRWDRGPAEWSRLIRSSAVAAPGGVLRSGIRSVVTQRIRVVRVSPERLPGGSCGPQRPL